MRDRDWALVTVLRSDRRAPVFDAMGSSMRRVGFIVTAIWAALAVLALAPAARADTGAPTGRVDGWHSPLQDTLELTVHATAPQGATLGSATLSFAGRQVTSPLCPGGQTCTDTGTDGVKLQFPTKFADGTQIPDGTYPMTVTISDADGTAATLMNAQPTEIWNDRPTGSATATLIIGSGVPAPPQGGNQPGGNVLGASAGSCVKPKLSMRLSQKPLRIHKGVPVLVKGKRYRFSGRLTCLVNNKRVSAPKRTRVELRQIVHGKSHLEGRATVGSHGTLVARFSVPSSRTLEFRFTTADRKVTRVRIKVQVVKVAKQKHKKG